MTDLAVTVFRRAKANRCVRSELTQARRGRCHKRQQRRKVIKRRMYNYRKHGTNEPTVTEGKAKYDSTPENAIGYMLSFKFQGMSYWRDATEDKPIG